MPNKIPNSPFSTRLSGSAKETELRLRNIFQWKKKRPPVALFLLTAVLVLSCCGLVSCQPQTEFSNAEDPLSGNIELIRTGEVLSGTYDFDHDGTPEITELVTVSAPESTQAAWYELQIKASDGSLLWSEDAGTTHAGWNSLLVCSLDDKDYLLRYHPTMYQGICNYEYTLFSLAPGYGTKEIIRQSNNVEFNTNFGSMISVGFDGTAVADFMEEINDLLSHSKLLLSTDEELDGIDPDTPRHTPGWLTSDYSYWGYTYDEIKTMQENILAFGKVVNAVPRPEYYELHSLTLDEDGASDDSIILTIYKDEDGSRTGQVDARILLGNGETLTWDCSSDEIHYWSAGLQAAYLTSTDHQCVVVQFPVFGSNYGAAQYYVIEVINGVLEVFDFNATRDGWDALNGFEIASLPDSKLSCVRIPVAAGTKWNGSEWVTLTWDNGQWNYAADGYFTDTYTLTVDGGMELTLALRGRHGGDSYLYYDQVQILHGETVLQTITEDSFAPDDHCPFEYFNADAAYHHVLAYDINFDENTDFGIPCNTTHNDGHVWFLYDPQTRQYRFAFSLAGTPTVIKESQQITEEWWDDSIDITYNTYEYNAQGELIMVDSRTDN